jgi:hypothetical protein
MAKKINTNLLKFKIDQLRKDKMIYALESIALTFVVELCYILVSVIIGRPYSEKVAVICLVIPLMYFIYMSIGNISRWMKIKNLERELYR